MAEKNIRGPNVFERMLLVIGIVVVIVGYGIIHKLILINNALTWDVVISIFLWFIIIILIVLTAVAENVKEEIRTIIEKETEKIRVMRKGK